MGEGRRSSRLLLVEDMYSENLIAWLSGYMGRLRSLTHVDTARSFNQAIDRFRRAPYDFVLTDYDLDGIIPGALFYLMPTRYNGMTLAEEIRKMPGGNESYIHLHSRRIDAGLSPSAKHPYHHTSWEMAVERGTINSFSPKWVLDDLILRIEQAPLIIPQIELPPEYSREN